MPVDAATLVARIRTLVARGEGREVRDRDDPFPALAPRATEDAIVTTEQVLGARLPPLLRRLFLEVGNGGFGPGFGVAGAHSGFRIDYFGTLDEGLTLCRHDDPNWPAGLAPLVHFGCGDWVFLATLEHAGTMIVFDEDTPIITGIGLDEFLTGWVDGRNAFRALHHESGAAPRMVTNPFTKKPVVLAPPMGRPRGEPWPGYVIPRSQRA